MDLLEAFKNYITRERLFTSGDRLLLAVSGGLDSVVLCELAYRAGFNFTIAHCNFHLRGAESDRDEAFVRQLGTRYGHEVLVASWDTKAYAAENNISSMQVAARILRYEWFAEVLDGWGGGGALLTAHHRDDNVETMLMNFFRGTGIAGLRGMLPRQGRIVRPLLFASRVGLEDFAGAEGLAWVEDSSNESDIYTRNFFRHQVIPLIRQAYPMVSGNLADNIDVFRDIETVYRRSIDAQIRKLVEHKGSEVHIPVWKLLKSEPLPTLIYELFTPYGFTPGQTGSGIGALLHSPSGKYICSATHRLLKDRRWLIISPLEGGGAATVVIEKDRSIVDYAAGRLTLEWLPESTGQLTTESPVAWLDAGQIDFPLLLRPWKPGDYFYPLGMRKKKKLARFFIDQKLSLAEKEKVWVLEMNKKIIWVVGRRIDDRFKLTNATRQVLRITVSG
jgi:tRNA(Ile)-lysidine synthase